MNEDQNEAVEQEEVKPEETATNKRKTLSLGERIKVIDYLRSLVEPIVADSNSSVAAVVSAATGIELNWQQLKYMIDDATMAEWNLSSKVHVKAAFTSDDDRISALEARIVQLESRMSLQEKLMNGDE